MPEIQAFRGVRYNLGRVGALSDVVTPPYDVIGPELQDHFYKLHPNSFIRIDLNKIEPGDDDEQNNRYTRAAKIYKQWRDEGVLPTEADPAIYVYHQEFTAAGTTYVRKGFLGRQRLTRFGEGQVFPHEETLPAAKVDRLMLMVTTKANLSPMFGLYPDPNCEADTLLDAAIAGKTPLVATDHLGVVHRLWPVTDVAVISKLSAIMGPKPMFIADGHHRYETACNYREQIHDSGFLSPEHPANYMLMMCVAMDDPGLIVMPTHRLFRSKGRRPTGRRSNCRPAIGPDLRRVDRQAEAVLHDPACRQGPDGGGQPFGKTSRRAASRGRSGFTRKRTAAGSIATLTEAGKARMAEVAKEHSEAWQSLGVSLLHRLIIGDLLGCKRSAQAGLRPLDRGGDRGAEDRRVPLAAVVMPATVEHIRTISMGGERMPAKSTYFYPKLLSGLVINPLE